MNYDKKRVEGKSSGEMGVGHNLIGEKRFPT